MEDKLDLIILQNWIILVFVVLLWFSTVVFNYRNQRRKNLLNLESTFGKLWDADKIEILLIESAKILEKYPNREDALYFRAKALRKIGRDEEALIYFKRLKDVDPYFSEEVELQINDIQTANK